jgi:methionine biosynthesis protein MetW
VPPYERDAVDLSNERSSWTHVARQVGREKDVLDLGCWDGLLLSTLRDRASCRGTGVERDPGAAARARARGVAVVAADLDVPGWSAGLAGRRVGVVVLADVLEHVRDPVAVLREAVERCLDGDGVLVLSVPNVAHGSVRLGLLLGSFERPEEGLLDRTHLHFWTRRTFHEVLAAAGLALRVESCVRHPLEPEVVRAALARAGLGGDALVHLLCEDDEATTFQWVVTVAPGTPVAPPAVAPPAVRDPLRVADRTIRAQARKIARLQQRLDALERHGPWKWVRYAALRLKQRREGADGPR